MPKRKINYRKEGYPCTHARCKEVFKRPQELGVHMKHAHPKPTTAELAAHTHAHHSNGNRSVANRQSTPFSEIASPNLLVVTGRGDKCEFYLTDADDSTRMMHLDRVIQVTLE